MKSDLHHIRGSWSSSNSGRSNYPFADINDEDVVQAYQSIRRELDLYSDKMAAKPEVVVLNKAET